MTKPFKKLNGNRIYLLYPQEPKRDLILSDEAKRQIEEDRIKQMTRLTVYAVGDNVTGISEGDEVMIDPVVLMRKPLIIDLTPEIQVICVNFLDISHVW